MTRQRLLLVLGTSTYALTLQLAYAYIISPDFSYRGLVHIQLAQPIPVLEFVFSIIPSFSVPLEISRPSQFQLWVLYLLVIIPANTIGYHALCIESPYSYALFMLTVLICFDLMSRISTLKPLHVHTFKLPTVLVWVILILFTAISYYFCFHYLGTPESILTLDKASIARALVKDQMQNVPLIFRYIITWQGIIINPLLLAIGYIRRNLLIIATAIILQLLAFTLTSLRSLALSIVFITLIWILMNYVRRNRGLAFFVLIFSLTTMSVGATLILSGELLFPPYVILERLLCLPGFLTGAYYDYFMNHHFVFFSESICRSVIEYPYGNLTVGQVIGDAYLYQGPYAPLSNATANLWADSYANFGYLGVIVFSLLSSFVLRIVDGAFIDVDPRISVVVFSTVALSLAAQGLHRCLFTGGLVPVIFVGIIAGNLLRFPGTRGKVLRQGSCNE